MSPWAPFQRSETCASSNGTRGRVEWMSACSVSVFSCRKRIASRTPPPGRPSLSAPRRMQSKGEAGLPLCGVRALELDIDGPASASRFVARIPKVEIGPPASTKPRRAECSGLESAGIVAQPPDDLRVLPSGVLCRSVCRSGRNVTTSSVISISGEHCTSIAWTHQDRVPGIAGDPAASHAGQ